MSEPYPPIGSGGASNSITSPDSESRELVAGTNITFDTATPGQLEISASGGGGGGLFPGLRISIDSDSVHAYTMTNTESTVIVTGSGALTLTLPPISTMTNGTAVAVNQVAGANITIEVNPADDPSLSGISGIANTSFSLNSYLDNNAQANNGPFLFVANTNASAATNDYQWFFESSGIVRHQYTHTIRMPNASGNFNASYYQFYSAEGPSSGTAIGLYDPGVNVALGYVDELGIGDGNIPAWTAGPGAGGYFSDSGLKFGAKGKSTLVGGTVTVSTAAVTSASNIQLTVHTPGGTQGNLSVGTIVDNTSFVINSTSGTETSAVDWVIFN